jgi:hypothetical protein
MRILEKVRDVDLQLFIVCKIQAISARIDDT